MPQIAIDHGVKIIREKLHAYVCPCAGRLPCMSRHRRHRAHGYVASKQFPYAACPAVRADAARGGIRHVALVCARLPCFRARHARAVGASAQTSHGRPLPLHAQSDVLLRWTLILLGWAWSFHSLGVLVYAGVTTIAFHLRVLLGEEPWLARTYGDDWRRYASQVPRWFWKWG